MREIDYQRIFVRYCKDFLGYKILKPKDDKTLIPDAWVKNSEGEEIPVEVKRFEFDEKALTQLQNYMNHFGASKGIAVGSKLTAELPKNIIFFKHFDVMAKMNAQFVLEENIFSRNTISVFDNVNAERIRHCLTQDEFCRLIDADRDEFREWSKKGDMPCMAVIKCSKIFKCSLDYLTRDVTCEIVNHDSLRDDYLLRDVKGSKN